MSLRHCTAPAELTDDQILVFLCGPHFDQLSQATLQTLKDRIAKSRSELISDPNKIVGAPYNPIYGVRDVIEFGPSHYLVIWENEGAIQAKMWNQHFVRNRADLFAAVDMVGNGMIGLQYDGEDEDSSLGFRLCAMNWAHDELWHITKEGALVWLRAYGHKGRWITFPTRPPISDSLLIASLPSLTEEQEKLPYPREDWRRLTQATS
ncbi:hypothetical protein GGX14DRAFT_570561 [Mycena pura]|uniref:Uncharacterized protein n=1 Tax=Mycena pura TaxID=153505 RepID=A0AAD6V595_9AGAR|nr:hypothetical protein GGX14DRAFT_570561 [Mycena pura]